MPKASQQDFRCVHKHAHAHTNPSYFSVTLQLQVPHGATAFRHLSIYTPVPVSLILIFFLCKPRGLDGSSVWEPPLSYKQEERGKKNLNEATLKQQFTGLTNHKVKQNLPSCCCTYSGKQVPKCKSNVTLIRADTLQCYFMYPNVSVCSTDWALHQACRLCLCMCLCVCILCQCQEPLRRGG